MGMIGEDMLSIGCDVVVVVVVVVIVVEDLVDNENQVCFSHIDLDAHGKWSGDALGSCET
jgi:hypothetical protein